MATELVGGAILQAVFGVLLDRLTPRVEFLNFIRVKKLDGILLHRLKPTLLAARAVLNDAELKQIKNSAVKEWLDDLKDAVYDTEDLVDEISTKAATQNQECLRGALKGKTIILVTNQVDFLHNVDLNLLLTPILDGNALLYAFVSTPEVKHESLIRDWALLEVSSILLVHTA